MKNLIVLFSILIISFSGQPGILAKQTEAAWTQLAEFKIHTCNVVGFLNETQGITVGAGGVCYYTVDGGKTWSRALNRSLCCYALDIVNESIAWNCGNGSQVRVSKDGGKTWIPVADCNVVGNFISFINDRTGWIASEEALVATNDGGAGWTRITIPTRTIAAMAFLSGNEGYLLDKTEPTLYITKDAGKTWVTQKTNLQEVPVNATMRWFNSSHGVIVGYSIAAKKEIIFETTDAGINWQQKVILDKLSVPFLTRDGKMLTLIDTDYVTRVFRCNEIP